MGDSVEIKVNKDITEIVKKEFGILENYWKSVL